MNAALKRIERAAAAVWIWPTDGKPLRGCVACDYGRDLATSVEHRGVLCRHPEVTRRDAPMPTDEARRLGRA